MVDFFSSLIKHLHLEQKAALPDGYSLSTTVTSTQMASGTYVKEIKGHSHLHWRLEQQNCRPENFT